MLEVEEAPMWELRAGNSHTSNSVRLLVDPAKILASWAVVLGGLDRAFHLPVEANCKRPTEKNGVKRNKKQ